MRARKFNLRVIHFSLQSNHMNAVLYVLFNKQKHEKGICSTIDGYSSLLLLKDAYRLIKEYAQKKKIILKVDRSQWFEIQSPLSYFLKTVFD